MQSEEPWELVPPPLDLTFLLGGRIIAMGFPGSPMCPVEAVERELRPTATRRVRVWNLAESQADYGRVAQLVRVIELRWNPMSC